MRISPTILDIITALRTAIEMDDSSHTTSLTRELSRLPEFEGSTATAGYHVSPEGDIKDDHWWLIMDDGSVFDADADEPTRCSKKDSRHGRYFPYTGETGIPAAVLQAADHIRAKSRTANNKSFSDMVGEAAENHDTQIQNAGISGFGGQCFSAAIKINHQFFNGEGEYVIAFNKAFMQHGVFYGHAAVLHNGTYWDADGKPKEVYDIESWGMLAEDDPDYQEQAAELGFEFDENNAYDVGMKIVDEKTLQQYCSMNEASGASAPSGVARQAPEALPDAMNVDGKEGIVVDEFDDETKPEDLQMGWEDLVGEDEGDLKEVDHPEYMPDGETGTANYDPTYDERSVHTNAGWPRP